jgi:hypothetical protein
MLFVAIVMQFAYGYYLYSKGYLIKNLDEDIDLGLNDPNILSNYIKVV